MMDPMIAVVLLVLGVAIGWVARGLRAGRRDAVYSFESQTPSLKVKADKPTDEELRTFIAKWEESSERARELARTATWATASTSMQASRNPHVFVQWKGTDVCLDFHCDCGGGGHYDGDFAYGLRCADCGTEWLMPHTFGLLPDADGAIQDTDMPHRERPTTDVRFAEVVDEDEREGEPGLVKVDIPFGGWIVPPGTQDPDDDRVGYLIDEGRCHPLPSRGTPEHDALLDKLKQPGGRLPEEDSITFTIPGKTPELPPSHDTPQNREIMDRLNEQQPPPWGDDRG